jgi:hypothetical protein
MCSLARPSREPEDADFSVRRPDVVGKHVARLLEREAEADVVIGHPPRAFAAACRRRSRCTFTSSGAARCAPVSGPRPMPASPLARACSGSRVARTTTAQTRWRWSARRWRQPSRFVRDTRTTHAPPATTQAADLLAEGRTGDSLVSLLVCGSSPGRRITAASEDLLAKAARVGVSSPGARFKTRGRAGAKSTLRICDARSTSRPDLGNSGQRLELRSVRANGPWLGCAKAQLSL